MWAEGDDPTRFVRPGVDWFHVNAATYDPRDDSVIVSSRENFVIKLDYATGTPIWILGDPTKYWAQFPRSARRRSRWWAEGSLPSGSTRPPSPPTASSWSSTTGAPSLNQPPGAPAGQG